MNALAVLVFIVGTQVNHMDVVDMRTCRFMLETYSPPHRGITSSHCEPKAPALVAPMVTAAPIQTLGGVLHLLGR